MAEPLLAPDTLHLSIVNKLSGLGSKGFWMITERKVCGVGGERVRQFRTALGMTHEQREAASAVPQGRIASIDCETTEYVYASAVIGFAKALHVSADYLVGLKAEEDGDREEETTTTLS